MPSPAYRLVLMGPPGSGKSSQAERIAARFDLAHLSTGQILREEVALGTELGREAQRYMAEGHLAPTSLVNGIVRDAIRRLGGRGFVLDGYPRTQEQARDLDAMLAAEGLALDAAIHVDLDEAAAQARLASRRVCLGCKTVYREADLPRGATRCPKCGGILAQRADDKPDIIHERFEVYEETMKPVLDYYRADRRLRSVDGDADIDTVAERVQAALPA